VGADAYKLEIVVHARASKNGTVFSRLYCHSLLKRTLGVDSMRCGLNTTLFSVRLVDCEVMWSLRSIQKTPFKVLTINMIVATSLEPRTASRRCSTRSRLSDAIGRVLLMFFCCPRLDSYDSLRDCGSVRLLLIKQ
jgi:hypothetical protein